MTKTMEVSTCRMAQGVKCSVQMTQLDLAARETDLGVIRANRAAAANKVKILAAADLMLRMLARMICLRKTRTVVAFSELSS